MPKKLEANLKFAGLSRKDLRDGNVHIQILGGSAIALNVLVLKHRLFIFGEHTEHDKIPHWDAAGLRLFYANAGSIASGVGIGS